MSDYDPDRGPRLLLTIAGVGGLAFGGFIFSLIYAFSSMVDPELPETVRRAEIWRRVWEHGGGLALAVIASGILLIVLAYLPNWWRTR